MRTLKDLFLDELADRYDAEKRLVIAMPKMVKAATCTHLQKLIQAHLKETERHVKKLAKVFRAFGKKPRVTKCEATIGLLKEGAEIMADNKGWPVLNAAIISIAQKVEHYEIATYGCLRNWAKLLGNKDAAGLLQEILVEEKAANHELSELARSRSNYEALGTCNGVLADCDTKATKSVIVKRAKRPLVLNRTRSVLV